MTAQVPDAIKYEGQLFSLLDNPLEEFFGPDRSRPPFVPEHTANWRGYIATWAVEDHLLLLESLQGQVCIRQPDGSGQRSSWCQVGHQGSCDVRRIDESYLFPEAIGAIPATWFSGELTIPTGEMTQYVHAGYASQYESYIILHVEHGHVASAVSLNEQQYQKRSEQEWAERQREAKAQRRRWWQFWKA